MVILIVVLIVILAALGSRLWFSRSKRDDRIDDGKSLISREIEYNRSVLRALILPMKAVLLLMSSIAITMVIYLAITIVGGFFGVRVF